MKYQCANLESEMEKERQTQAMAKLNAQIDSLKAEFSRNGERLQSLRSERCWAEYHELYDRQRAINDEIHGLLEQIWSLEDQAQQDCSGRCTYEVTVKEVGHDHPITTSYTGDVTREFIIDFFGLKQPDVEWYKIRIREEGR